MTTFYYYMERFRVIDVTPNRTEKTRKTYAEENDKRLVPECINLQKNFDHTTNGCVCNRTSTFPAI